MNTFHRTTSSIALIALLTAFPVTGDAQTATEGTDPDTTMAPTDTAPAAEAPMDPAADPEMAATEEPAHPIEGQIIMQSQDTILAEDLIGSSVYSTDGEDIGDINDLIVNLDGTVEGVVIGVGGFLGLGKKLVAIQMSSLSTMTDDAGNIRLVSSATKTDLEAAEAFITAADQAAAQRALEATPPVDPNAAAPTDG